MATKKSNSLNIFQIPADLKKGIISPIYFLYGNDTYGIDISIKAIEKGLEPIVTNEFDKETIYGSDIKGVEDILRIATSFPFGSEKKLLIVKEFEKFKDKKNLTSYFNNPAEFTILVLIHNGSITNINTQPFKILFEKNFSYEAKELNENALAGWLVSIAKDKGKILSEENAFHFVDTVGVNRNLLEMQFQKVIEYTGNNETISFETIKNVVSSLKEYNIFDLQNAVARKDKVNSMKIAFNLLESGNDIIFIIAMLNRYFIGLAQITELEMNKVPDKDIARIIGTHPYYLKEYKAARRLFPDNILFSIFNALFEADLSVKTTSTDPKSIITVLLTKILS